MRLLVILLAIVLASPAAHASCTVSAATMNFGIYTGAASTPGPTPITVNCTIGTIYNLAVNAGVNSGGVSYNWNVLGPVSSTISYKLYRDSARSMLLGGSVGTDTVTGLGTGSNQTIYIYPSVAANGSTNPGTYTDSVTISVLSLGPTVTTTMPVTALVLASCTITASPLSFGTYSGAVINASTSLVVTCTNTTSYSANIDGGLYPSGFYQPRMIGPSSAYLSYRIYRDAALTQPWGNTANVDGDTGVGSGAAQTLTVYGQLPAGQYATPGSYSDTATVTLNY